MFTIDYIYGGARLFDTLEQAELYASKNMSYDLNSMIISEVKKVIRPKRPIVEMEEVDISTIHRLECSDCPQAIVSEVQ